MSSRARTLAAALCVLLLAAVVSACRHTEEHTEVVEGEHLELGELTYQVKLTRFLNPNEIDDSQFLEGQPDADVEEAYLGTFLVIHNESDVEQPLPDEITIVDTRGERFEPVETDGVFALDLDESVPADGELPPPDSAAAHGTAGGAILIFRVSREVTENRPLELEIPGPDGEAGTIELDI